MRCYFDQIVSAFTVILLLMWLRTCVVCNRKTGDDGVTLFAFPKAESTRYAKWIKAINGDGPPIKSARVCSLHFSEESFQFISISKKVLKKTAVPEPAHLNWRLHSVPLQHRVSPTVRSYSINFRSPQGQSTLSPTSPHVNLKSIVRQYGSNSWKRKSSEIQPNASCSNVSNRFIISYNSHKESTTSQQFLDAIPKKRICSVTGASDTSSFEVSTCSDTSSFEVSTCSDTSSFEVSTCNDTSSFEVSTCSDTSSFEVSTPFQEGDGQDNLVDSHHASKKRRVEFVSSPGNNLFKVTVKEGLGQEKNVDPLKSKISKLQKQVANKNKLIHRLRMQVIRAKRNPKRRAVKLDDLLTAVKPLVKPTMFILLEAQMKLRMCKKKGMRWSDDMKDFTLSLIYHGPRGYRYLSKLIPLPSISTMKRYQSRLPLKAGLHEHVKRFLKEYVQSWPARKKICTLLVDEVTISENLSYVEKGDFVLGYTDDGTNRSSNTANQAIVAAFSGIIFPWMQIVGHWFVNDTDKRGKDNVTSKVIKDCIDFTNEVGLTLKVIICDQGSKNRKAARLRGVTEKKPYFMNGKEKVYWMWDPPHLIKSLRNNLLKHDLVWRGHIVTWRYILAAFFEQLKWRLKLTPKITRRHVLFKTSFLKMKVKLATQIFSNAYYHCLLAFVAFKRLSAKAIWTANCVKDVNDLFDCFNSMKFKKDKLSLRYALSLTSEHIQFLKKMLGHFENAKFLGMVRQPYCLKGWIQTINALLMLVEDLNNNHDVKSVRTRLLNQDKLENAFCITRQQHGCCTHPTCRQLERGVAMTSLSSVLKVTEASNCESEMEKSIIRLSKLPKTLTVPDDTPALDTSLAELSSFNVNFTDTLDVIEENGLYYCCGFLTRKFLRKHKCNECQRKLLVDPDKRLLEEQYQLFIYLKAHQDKLGTEFGGLTVPTYDTFMTLKKIDEVFHQYFSLHAHEKNIARQIKMLVEVHGLSLHLCSEQAEKDFLDMYINTRILWEVRFKNRNFEEARQERIRQNKLKKLNAQATREKKKIERQNRVQRKKLGRAFAKPKQSVPKKRKQ